MKKATLILIFFPFWVFSQSEKGVSPLADNRQSRTAKNTYAVVVGISDYHDKDIPDLRFAHKDAEAFAAWLRSPAGGNVSNDNVSLLLGNKATNAAIGTALFSMIDVCKPGDRFIFYFSGHGDVETKTRTQPGYLLTWDSPAQVYMVGALNLRDLQDIVSTLSDNKVEVVIVTDACHSGKLAGESVGGTQATAQALAKQYANEVKIMSCQPNELSLESEQWGGGRGVFSWHLLDGLTGLSDMNNDGMVTLFEITRYLQDMVPTETDPHSQMPFSTGDLQTRLNRVDTLALAFLKNVKSEGRANLFVTGSKGLEDQVLAGADAVTRVRYGTFKTAIQQGNLLEPLDSNANDLYHLLIISEQLKPLRGLMTRELVVALMNEAQQALNALLNDDPYEHNQWQYNPEKYANYPKYLAKAIELLGEHHYMYKTLMAKKFFFEARTLATEQIDFGTGTINNDSLNRATRLLLEKGLSYDPDAAYLYYAIGNTWFNTYYGAGLDSFFYNHKQAIALSPTWIMPRLDVINSYLFNYITTDWKPCEQYLLNALKHKPESYVLTLRLAWLYQRMDRMDEAVEVARKICDIRPDLSNGYATLSSTYLALRQYDLAEEFAWKALSVDSTVWTWPMNNLRRAYTAKRQYEKAFKTYPMFVAKGLERNTSINVFGKLKLPGLMKRYQKYYDLKFPTNSPCDVCDLIYYGDINFRQGEFLEAKKLYLKSLPLSPSPDVAYVGVYTDLAQIAWFEHKPDSAEYYFQKAINYYPDLFGSWCGTSFYPLARFHYARLLIAQNRLAEAEAQLLEAEESDPRCPDNYYGMAILHAHQKHQKEALDWLAKALEWYFPDYDEIMGEPLFKKIRKTRRFKSLMKQYFPNGSDRPLVERLAREYLPEIFK